jgi:hypothetical protein
MDIEMNINEKREEIIKVLADDPKCVKCDRYSNISKRFFIGRTQNSTSTDPICKECFIKGSEKLIEEALEYDFQIAVDGVAKDSIETYRREVVLHNTDTGKDLPIVLEWKAVFE